MISEPGLEVHGFPVEPGGFQLKGGGGRVGREDGACEGGLAVALEGDVGDDLAFEYGHNGDILVQKAPACTLQTQAEAVCELFGGDKSKIKAIGIRHGEKMYETLLTNEECSKAIDMGNFYRVPADNRSLNYDKFFTEGDKQRISLSELNLHNTKLLNFEETKTIIASLEYI